MGYCSVEWYLQYAGSQLVHTVKHYKKTAALQVIYGKRIAAREHAASKHEHATLEHEHAVSENARAST